MDRKLKLALLFGFTGACAVASLFPQVAPINVAAVPVLVLIAWRVR